MARFTMKLEGMQSLQRAIVRSPEVVKTHATSAVATTTFAIGQSMRARVPVASGVLKQSIYTATRGLSGRVLISPAAYYWRFLEYGTVNMAARPFVRPVAEMESNPFIARMRAIGPKLERDFSTGRFL